MMFQKKNRVLIGWLNSYKYFTHIRQVRALSRNRVIFQLFQYHDRTPLHIATKVWYNFVSHAKIVVSTS